MLCHIDGHFKSNDAVVLVQKWHSLFYRFSESDLNFDVSIGIDLFVICL